MSRKLIAPILMLSLILGGCAQPGTDTKGSGSGFNGGFIVNANFVKENAGDDKYIFIDARGKEKAAGGKVKNAIPLTWQEIADVEGKKPGENGWGHILGAEKLSNKLGELGISKDKTIVLYSTGKAGWGEDGRILWELKAAGYKNLKMVDGGIDAIKATGIELVKDDKVPAATKVEIASIDYTNIINTEELTKDIKNYKIVDSREKDEYEGAVKFGEAKGGHIPGAVNIPYSSLYKEDGKLKSNEEITKLFEDAGLTKDDSIVTYCTGGIRSAFMQLMMEMTGFSKVKNYEGSYYNWASVNEVEK